MKPKNSLIIYFFILLNFCFRINALQARPFPQKVQSSSPSLNTQQEKSIQFVMKIQKSSTTSDIPISLFSTDKKIPAIPMNEKISKKIEYIKTGEDVLVKGHIGQHSLSSYEGVRLIPIFVIEDIKSLSLKDLQISTLTSMDSLRVPDFSDSDLNQTLVYLPIPEKVASTLILTTGLLLFQDLTQTNQSNQFQQDTTSLLLLSTGAIATALFFLEEIKGK